MAVENGVEESYQQFNGTSSTSGFVGQLTGTANDENGTKNKDSHGEQPHSSILDTAGSSKKNEKYISNTEHEKKAKRRTSDCKLHLNSPRERESRLHSRGQSRRKSRSPSGSSSSSSRSRSRTYKSRSRSTSRSASHGSRHRRYKRSSRSSSRSRSRSPGSRYRRHHSRSHRSPRRYNRSRSRSRSHVKVYYGRYRSRSRSRSCSRGRRRYGFVHRPRPATFRSRSRTRSISRSRSLHLTEKDRLELLEIAKANAAKALGKSVDLPPSLKKNSWLSDTLHRSLEWDFTKLNKQSRNLNNTVIAEVSPQKAANVSSIDSTVVHPVLNKQVNSLGSSPKKEEPKKAQGQWIPIQCQRSLNRLR